jgi:hypothetical protein
MNNIVWIISIIIVLLLILFYYINTNKSSYLSNYEDKKHIKWSKPLTTWIPDHIPYE